MNIYMNFEDVLPQMRLGKKARMQSDKEDGTYWICGKSGNPEIGITMSSVIIKMQKDGTYMPNRWSWGIPTWAIMADDWEIFE